MTEGENMRKLCDTKSTGLILAAALAQGCFSAEAQDYMKTSNEKVNVVNDAEIKTSVRSIKDATLLENASEILSGTPHKITDAEYFKIARLLTPGEWSAQGHNHEISMRSATIAGKPALVYDFWSPSDPSKDGPTAQMQSNDIRTRVVFFPDAKRGELSIRWLRCGAADFDSKAPVFDRTLQSGNK
jgi:hypothetical protein